MRNSVQFKNIYIELSKKYALSLDTVEKMCDSQFEFTKKVISSGEDLPIRLQYLGLFSVPTGRRAMVQLKRDRIKKVHEKRKNDTK